MQKAYSASKLYFPSFFPRNLEKSFSPCIQSLLLSNISIWHIVESAQDYWYRATVVGVWWLWGQGVHGKTGILPNVVEEIIKGNYLQWVQWEIFVLFVSNILVLRSQAWDGRILPNQREDVKISSPNLLDYLRIRSHWGVTSRNECYPKPNSLSSFYDFIDKFLIFVVSFFGLLKVGLVLETILDVDLNIISRQILEV